MDFKKEFARKVIPFIKNKTTVGLGAGSTIAFMIEFLAEEVKKGLALKLVTSSFTTHQLLLQNGFTVQAIADVMEIDIYFDGCDQFDKDLNALKSGGGIHTREKLLASMARQFILVGGEAKYAERLDTKFPLVIELLPESHRYVLTSIQKLFPDTKIVLRISDKKDGATITENGNYLLDCWFTSWPDLGLLNSQLKAITGVVETSLFYQLADKAIIAGGNGIKILEKNTK
jgi:ribose 5-phosphate isomerase A